MQYAGSEVPDGKSVHFFFRTAHPPRPDTQDKPTNYERLGIALENTDDTSKSDFMVLDVSVVGDGKTLEGMEFIGKFGRVVDLIYKIGNQWDTY